MSLCVCLNISHYHIHNIQLIILSRDNSLPHNYINHTISVEISHLHEEIHKNLEILLKPHLDKLSHVHYQVWNRKDKKWGSLNDLLQIWLKQDTLVCRKCFQRYFIEHEKNKKLYIRFCKAEYIHLLKDVDQFQI